ncbi:MAG: hypothetical protein ABL956_01755 [Hyphomonadaceae bacterium]
MSSSTSSSDAPRAGAPRDEAKRGARLFLGAMAGGVVLSAAIASVLPEAIIHTPPEFGMAEALEDHIQQACARKAAPELLIIGDSRAVAGISVQTLRASGIDTEKFALGGAGVFAGWGVLDRLVDCGVRPKTVAMAYGAMHVLGEGSLMVRLANYDVFKGPRASHVYDMASEWEDSLARQAIFKAVSLVGTELSLTDVALMRPALRNVLAAPAHGAGNFVMNEKERVSFLADGGDRFYGTAQGSSELPDEKLYGAKQQVPQMNYRATEAVTALGRKHGFNVLFYMLPLTETASAKLPRGLLDTTAQFMGGLPAMGVTPMNRIWSLPDADFGDPSHVNARGRVRVTEDFRARYAGLVGASGAGPGEADHAVSLPIQKIQQVGK